MKGEAILKLIDILLAAISGLQNLGVNYQEVLNAQQQAEAEGRELTAAERQRFIDEAATAVGDL